MNTKKPRTGGNPVDPPRANCCICQVNPVKLISGIPAFTCAECAKPDADIHAIMVCVTNLNNGTRRIASERLRQIIDEGRSVADDVKNAHSRRHMLVQAALCYARFASYAPDVRDSIRQAGWIDYWPWSPAWWKPGKDNSFSSRIRELEKAGALLAGEIDVMLAMEDKEKAS